MKFFMLYCKLNLFRLNRHFNTKALSKYFMFSNLIHPQSQKKRRKKKRKKFSHNFHLDSFRQTKTKHTSALNGGILVFGANTTSTLHVPPFGSSVIWLVGEMLRIPGCCNATGVVIDMLNVMGAGLLFTMGMYFLTTSFTTREPRFTHLCFGSATSIWNTQKSYHN